MKMSDKTTRSFWIQVSLASLTGTLLIVTLVFREWIEVILRITPDRESGALEWVVVALLFFATVVFTFFARYEWVRFHSSAK